MPYNFGVYHWRRRFRSVGLGAGALAAGAVVARRADGWPGRLLGAGAAAWGLVTAGGAVRTLASAPPWHVEPAKYRALAAELPVAEAGRLLDVGCGTGRSLVGLAGAVPADCEVLGLDVFDARVILGNGPGLARRNAARAGLDVTVLRGDAARLPVADGTVDVVTACRVLHDLPREAAGAALAEARRVLAPGGTLGVLELPITHEEGADPATYWRDRVREAGFTVTSLTEPTHDGRRYVVLAAEP